MVSAIRLYGLLPWLQAEPDKGPSLHVGLSVLSGQGVGVPPRMRTNGGKEGWVGSEEGAGRLTCPP